MRPIDAFTTDIDDLFDAAAQFLDGEPISNEGQAEAVAKLLDDLRKARKGADDQRAVEKKPHDDAGKAVQALWKPLLDRCDLAVATAKSALAPYIAAKEAEQRAIADAARKEAERLADEARQASIAARGDDLTAQATVEAKLAAAEAAAKVANKADKAKANVAGGARAVSLRSSYRAEIENYVEFSRWAWVHRRADYEAMLIELANVEVRHGPVNIPGLNIITERKAA